MPALTLRAASSIGAILAGLTATTVLVSATPALADEDPSSWGLNGTFATSSNGVYAKLNERYEAQPGEQSTWTISTNCVSNTECTGTVKSSAGWTAPIYTTNGLYYVKRVLPNWRFCDDGTPVQGLQEIKIYPVGPDAHYLNPSNEFTGEDHTTGPSGSCGRNQWPVVRMPFYMKKIG
ncbi:hypothetical protein [Mycobacterium sp. OTB74]|uniref:hypothetical protein n=1 Tax=Mycobacterium sp. OTB74 TaxID=1853452 RepID=UPI0024738ED3|nr:hypothetical protein [Mycobacterium sp. OTB74]MDH6245340.1 hypothetical protein [Mycobacterium sp. OTB74]